MHCIGWCASWPREPRTSEPSSSDRRPRSSGSGSIVQHLQRAQFGRRSERLDGDQLALGLEDLDADIARVLAPLASPAERMLPTLASRPRALPEHLAREDIHATSQTRLPLLRRRAACDRRECQRDAGLRAGAPARAAHPPAQVRLPRLRHDPSGTGTGASDRQGTGEPRPAGPRAGQQVLRSPAALPAVPDLRPPGCRARRSTLANWVGGACWWLEPLQERLAAHVFASQQALRRRHADPGARSGPRSHQDRPAMGLRARRSTVGGSRSAGRRLLLQSGPQGRTSGLAPRELPRHSPGRRLCRVRAADHTRQHRACRLLGAHAAQVLRGARGNRLTDRRRGPTPDRRALCDRDNDPRPHGRAAPAGPHLERGR